MRSKKKQFGWLCWLALLAWSIEILAHRWGWGQVPTQIGAGWVYGLLVVNAGLLVLQRPWGAEV